MTEVFPRFQGYLLPAITLLKGTPKGAICRVFEYVNTSGVPLNVFELLTAQFAADDCRLRDEWEETETKLKKSGDVYNKILIQIAATDFLALGSAINPLCNIL
jgi:hypothetical protein